MKFIDRVKELAFLEEKWKEQKAQLVILWGKRRVGKTELTKQFIKDKPHVYFLSENTNDKEQLFRFSQALGHFYNEPLLLTRGFTGWQESFEYIKAKKQRFVLVIDEFPYLIWSNPGIPSLFQFSAIGRWWDSNEELDIIALNKASDTILFCEVKWSEKPVGINIYEELKQKAQKVQWGGKTRKEYFCLFSKKGFTDAMVKLALEDGVALFQEDKLVVPIRVKNE
jgi:AAA+ ATPase superfamily predicted ATPase